MPDWSKNILSIRKLGKSITRVVTIYNKNRKRKQRQYKENLLIKLNELRCNEPAKYWNLLKLLRENDNDNKSSSVSLTEWESYFKNLKKRSKGTECSNIENETNELEKQLIFNETDFPIKESEVTKCIKNLKNKKAAGLDCILNEMIKYSQSYLTPVYTKLFNEILRTGIYPTSWKQGYIIPIYKNGDRSDPNNYRGITIISNIAKLFNSVINNRLIKFIENNNLIDENQIGFKQKSRTSDHVFVLKSLIDKYLSNGNKLYTCFVDFRKAFDRVNHCKLIYKLRETNIGSMLYNTIKSMYSSSSNDLQVKQDEFISAKFSSEIGVRQGDSLSPTLFNLYINQINKYLDTNLDQPSIGSKCIGSLLYADDLILISKSKIGLQNALNKLYMFCKEWDMELNTKKTKIVIFNKGSRILNETFTFDDKLLENCKTYRYLGLLLHCSGNFSECIRDLYKRGLKAVFKLRKTFQGSFPSFNTCMHLFDHLVKPVLSYGSDIWGSFLVKGATIDFTKLIKCDLEKCHQMFLRFSIGINKKAPLIGLYGETGRIPLAIDMICNSLKYLNRLKDMPKNSILYQCYLANVDISHKNSWWSNISKVSKDFGCPLDSQKIKTSQLKDLYIQTLKIIGMIVFLMIQKVILVTN